MLGMYDIRGRRIENNLPSPNRNFNVFNTEEILAEDRTLPVRKKNSSRLSIAHDILTFIPF
jgi:hypothetical protein